MQKENQSVEIIFKKTSFIDILIIFLRRKLLFFRIVLAFLVIGILIAIISQSKYTSSAKLVPDLDSDSNLGVSRLAAISRSFGFDFGNSIQGITGEIYPEILTSRDVVYSVVVDSFFLEQQNSKLSFVEFNIKNKNIIIKLIKSILNIPKKIFNVSEKTTVTKKNFSQYSPDELAAMHVLSKKMLRVNMDLKKGVLEVAITSAYPELSKQLIDSFIRHLIFRIQEMFTEKTAQNYNFLKDRYSKSEEELNYAEKILADFLDQNTDPNNARLKLEQERLERNVTFKSELFSEIQKELTKAEIDLQKSKPVLTLLESPNLPLDPSEPKRLLIIISFMLSGIIFAIIVTLFLHFLEKSADNHDTKNKIDEIKSYLQVRKIFSYKNYLNSK